MSAVPPSKTQTSSPLIVITGPTASGKSSLALELAQVFGGEIICADSRTVYRGMDIGTAKPLPSDRRLVPHHVLDVVQPDEQFTAADFQRLAQAAIKDIRARGNMPFVVGGSGLYIDGLVLGFEYGAKADSVVRAELESKTVDELKSLLDNLQITIPRNDQNKRHLIRAIEQGRINTSRKPLIDAEIIVVAIATEKQELEQRIVDRTEEIFAQGVVEEARQLARRYGWDHEALTGNIYPILRRYLSGEITLECAKELVIIKDRQLAKKQTTWLKRHDYVKWLSLDEASEYLTDILSNVDRPMANDR